MKAKKDNKFPLVDLSLGDQEDINMNTNNIPNLITSTGFPTANLHMQNYSGVGSPPETQTPGQSCNAFGDVARPLTQLRNVPGPPSRLT